MKQVIITIDVNDDFPDKPEEAAEKIFDMIDDGTSYEVRVIQIPTKEQRERVKKRRELNGRRIL
jgi:hypothetical protein